MEEIHANARTGMRVKEVNRIPSCESPEFSFYTHNQLGTGMNPWFINPMASNSELIQVCHHRTKTPENILVSSYMKTFKSMTSLRIRHEGQQMQKMVWSIQNILAHTYGNLAFCFCLQLGVASISFIAFLNCRSHHFLLQYHVHVQLQAKTPI